MMIVIDPVAGTILIMLIAAAALFSIATFTVVMLRPLILPKPPRIELENELIRQQRESLWRMSDATIFKLRTTGMAFHDALIAAGVDPAFSDIQKPFKDFEDALFGYIGGDGKWRKISKNTTVDK